MRRAARVVGTVSTVAVVALGVFAVLPVAAIQHSAKTHRIGVLATGTAEELREALREVGYIEGRNVILDVRPSEGRSERLDGLARDLAHSNVDVIVAMYPAAVFAAKRATATVPIVMVNTPDPVQLGLVASLGRPGRNITGTTSLSVDLSIKQLELLKEAVPRASRIAVMWNPDNPWHPITVKGLQERGRSLGVQLQMVPVRDPNEFDAVFRTMMGDRGRAVLVLADPMTFVHRRRLADLAVRHRLPVMGGLREYAEAGSLMSYWADQRELVRKAASYVDRILKGARPDDLPIEQPTRYELVVNLNTARTLGLTLPPSLVLRATVID